MLKKVTFVENLKKLRKEKKLSQKEVADAIGVARSTYTQYELGDSQPAYEILKKLAEFFDVSVDYLLGIDHLRNRPSDAEKFEENIKKLDPKRVILFNDFANMDEEDFEQLVQFAKFLKNKRKKGE